MAASPWSLEALGGAFVMWSVMMMAMMLPSLIVPMRAVQSANRSALAGGRRSTPAALFAVGYFAVWVGFSVSAAALQAFLTSRSLIGADLALRTPRAGAITLIAAGVYQLTAWKLGCLSHCRSPLALVAVHWREGARGAFEMGLRHGAYCLGCCWALMLVLFAVGVMNLAWVVTLAAVVLIEKLGIGGAWPARIAGAGLILWGLARL